MPALSGTTIEATTAINLAGVPILNRDQNDARYELSGNSVTTVNLATYTILSSDYILGVTYTTTGSVTLTLPLQSFI